MSEPAALPRIPIPSANLVSRRIPVKLFNLAVEDIYRVHRKVHDPIFYNRKSASPMRFRWDSASDAFGVLYAAPELVTSLAETVIRSRLEGPLVIDVRELEERMYSRLGSEDKPILRLADLTTDLFAIGADMQINSCALYDAPNQWSDALYRHPEEFDGIYYPSRYTNRPAVAIFGRTKLEKRGAAVRLSESPEVGEILDRYNISAIDSPTGWEP